MTPAKDLEQLSEALCTIVKAVGIAAGRSHGRLDDYAVLELIEAFNTVHEFVKETR